MLRSDVNPQNIKYIPTDIPTVKILTRLDLEQNSSFLDGHNLTSKVNTKRIEKQWDLTG